MRKNTITKVVIKIVAKWLKDTYGELVFILLVIAIASVIPAILAMVISSWIGTFPFMKTTVSPSFLNWAIIIGLIGCLIVLLSLSREKLKDFWLRLKQIITGKRLITKNRLIIVYILWIIFNAVVLLNVEKGFNYKEGFYPFTKDTKIYLETRYKKQLPLYNNCSSYDFTEFFIYSILPIVVVYIRKLIKEDK